MFDLLFLFLRFPRLTLIFVGVAMIGGGWTMIGVFQREDAPLHRALGKDGLAVVATVEAQTKTYPRFTTLRYVVQDKEQRMELMSNPMVERLAVGDTIPLRLDPQNPKFFVQADKPEPWTKGKIAGCVIVIALGIILELAVLLHLLTT